MPRFVLPTEITLPRKKTKDKVFHLNLNDFRNTHYQTLSQAKRAFSPIVIPGYFTAEKIRITYHIQKKTKRRFDTGNVFAIVDKFFLDWLVINEYIPDDNCNNVIYGSITGENGCSKNQVICHIEILEE